MIAPEPVSAAIASGAERQPRTNAAAVPPSMPADSASTSDATASRRQAIADMLPPLPAPPDPPGTAYVAAVLSGALSPKPTTPHEIYLRTGEWTPPESPLRLADKII